MEIKLTADWIFSQGDEIYFTRGKGIIILYEYDFRWRLIQLVIDNMEVTVESNDYFTENEDGSIKDSFLEYSFENIEELKDPCPELYDRFKKTVINFDD